MATTVTVHKSYGSKLGDSFKGVLSGLLVFVAGFPLLFWNEGRAVKTARAIDEGEGACVSLESNAKVDPEMEGKLVHLSGKADTQDVLTDDEFGVSVTAISLERKVEMYQWVEHEKKSEKKNVGGSSDITYTYTYTKEWVGSHISSGNFKEQGHDNPGAMEFEGARKYAANVSFGAYRLNEKQIAQIGSSQQYTFPTNFVSRVERVKVQGATIYVPNAETRSNALNNRDVLGQPRIGDMRVTFQVVYPHTISLIAKQRGDSFVEYTAKNGKKLSYLTDGEEDAASMFATARSNNKILTWILRLVGFILMFSGLKAVFQPLATLGEVLPFLGSLLNGGISIVAFLLAFPCALATIGIAWLIYRPIVGIVLLVAAVGAIIGLLKLKSSRAAVAPAPAPVEPPAQ